MEGVGVSSLKIFSLLLALLWLSHCGSEVVWFVSWNGGLIEPTGLVVVIGSPRDEDPKQVRIVEGRLPKGLQLQADGTVRGIPEETGPFDFTLEFTDRDGSVEQQNFHGEITD